MEQEQTDPTFHKAKVYNPIALPGPLPRTKFIEPRDNAKKIKGAAFGRTLTDRTICDTLKKRVRKHKQTIYGYPTLPTTRSKAGRQRVANAALTPQSEPRHQKLSVPSMIQAATRAAMLVWKQGTKRGG